MEARKGTGVRKQMYFLGGLVAGIVGAGAVVRASVSHTFVNNETLTADNLNASLGGLDTRITALETKPIGTVQESASDAIQTGALSADVVYGTAIVTLSPGTWLVNAFASVSTDVAEGVELGLYDATASADIANSRGGVATTVAPAFGVTLHTSKVVTVTTTANVQMKGFRNGSSKLSFGYSGALKGGTNRIMAVLLK